METIYSEDHRLRDAQTELCGGQLVYPFERPSRMDYILKRLQDVDLGPITAPASFEMAAVQAVHDPGYLEFLETAWADWVAAGFTGEAMATNWPARRMAQVCPDHIDGKLGYYGLASETSITDGTWLAAKASASVALTGARRILGGAQSCFALCRPPGHHAALDMYGGYCFLNNAAIAAQSMRDAGMDRVAILDVDFHHGNGTQDIFYDRDDVLFISLHGEPQQAFPYFLGYATETGKGPGEGYTVNLPMPPGTPYSAWQKALGTALERVADFAPDALIVSLGVDTFENDPISFFKLTSRDFLSMGSDIAAARFPTLFVMEGGYDIDEIGINTVNVLEGFQRG